MFLFQVDSCKNYTVLSEADRAQRDASQSNGTCDRKDLVTGWYRFQGAVGDRMADKCVPKGHCGLEYRGWLNGSHPTITEGAVIRKVCFSGNKSCCLWRNLIKVKNCSFYYVYELQRNSSCQLRYCGNAGVGKLTCCLCYIF